MKLYNVLKRVNDNLGFKNNELLEYILNTCSVYNKVSDGVFIRSRGVFRDNILEDLEIIDCNFVLLSCECDISLLDLSIKEKGIVRNKFQIFFLKNKDEKDLYRGLNGCFGLSKEYLIEL